MTNSKKILKKVAGGKLDDNALVKGLIIEKLTRQEFRVQLDNGAVVSTFISGKLRRDSINLSVGDKVIVEMSPTRMNSGRIVETLK